MNIKPNQRRFHLQRDEDHSGVSGTGRVAEGCLFSNGKVVVVWLSPCSSTNIYENQQGVLQVHGHGGATKLVWDDPDELVGAGDVAKAALEEFKALPQGEQVQRLQDIGILDEHGNLAALYRVEDGA